MVVQDCIMAIEPRTAIRNALSFSVRAQRVISQATSHTSLKQALADLRSGGRADVIFISNTFDQEEVLYFVSAAKNSKAARDAAFILIMDKSNQLCSVMAKQILKGMDGFLSYPFNIEAVQTTVKIALGVKAQRMQNRIELASKMLLEELSTKLDCLVYDASVHAAELVLPKDIIVEGSILKSLSEEELPVYFDVLFKVFSNASPAVKFIELENPLTAVELALKSDTNPIIHALDSNSAHERLMALHEVQKSIQTMEPYIDDIKKRLNDKDPACRIRARAIIKQMTR